MVLHIGGVDEGAPYAFFFFGSQCELARSFSDDCSWNINSEVRIHHLDRFGALTQAAHLHCFVIVHFDEHPEPADDTFTTLFQQTCNISFNKAVAVFLLALSRVASCRTFLAVQCVLEILFFPRVNTVLYDQEPVRSPPVLLAATRHTPPEAPLLIPVIAVAMPEETHQM